MEKEMEQFLVRLSADSLSDQLIIDEKLHRFLTIDQPLLIAKLNDLFFQSDRKLTTYLRNAAVSGLRSAETTRKKIYQFIAAYVQSHHTYVLDHIKSLIPELVSLFWREEGKMREIALTPMFAVVEAYEVDFLVDGCDFKPAKLHQDVMTLLQTQKLLPGLLGQCWYLLSLLQSKFPTAVNSQIKRKVQQITFLQLKNYVNKDSNLATMAALLRALSCSLRQNYLSQDLLGELYRHAQAMMIPLKATYNVPLAALELLGERRTLFHRYFMDYSVKLFEQLREGVGHKNKEYSLKCLEVLMVVIQEFVTGISNNKQKYRQLFQTVLGRVLDDLQLHAGKEKGMSVEGKTLNLLSIIRVLGILSPLYLEFKGKKAYKQLFSYLIRKCSRKLVRDGPYFKPSAKGEEIKYLLYSQKETISFLDALAHLVEQLESIDYEEAGQLQLILTEAIKESTSFLPKYEPLLWEAMVKFIMSVQLKGAIFAKWAKKVVSEALRQCLDSKKKTVEDDSDYIRMITKAAHLWKSLLCHTSWRAGALQEFAQSLLANMEYLVLNLDCGYQVRRDETDQQENNENRWFQVFFVATESLTITKIEDYQYLSSLSLLFHEVLLAIDPSLFNDRLLAFYPQVLQRIRLYPKCLPLLRTLRTLNEYILKHQLFALYLPDKGETSTELLARMRSFFNETVDTVFKYQEQYFYELLKVLLSFAEEVYFLDNYRILQHHLPHLLIRTLQLGQQIIALADVAIKCIQRLFTQKNIVERYLSQVIPALEKFINVESKSEREEFKSQLFLSQLSITRQSLSQIVLSFLGSLGGVCHQLVDNTCKDHISWDYDCHLSVQLTLLTEKYDINLTRLLNRVCWLCVNGSEQTKIVACELLHAKLTYVVEEIVSNKMTKDNLAMILDRALPTVLAVAANSSHPSQQLIHSLLIQLVHFFANTKEPNSPDIQIILKHLLSLYNKSEDMGYLASKCLSQFIRWHIKQQPSKTGNLPVLKALMSNVWSLVGNRNAKEGLVNFLYKLLNIIHRQEPIMRYYALQFGSLLITLTRSHLPLSPTTSKLISKYVLCLKRYMKFLIIQEEGRRYKKLPTVHSLLDLLYRIGFFSAYTQQRQAAFIIWSQVIRNNTALLGYTQMDFLKARARRDNKCLFGSSNPINFQQAEESMLQKMIWKVEAFGEVWLKMIQLRIFNDDSLIHFSDLQCVYLTTLASFINFLLNQKEGLGWGESFQQAAIANICGFLKLVSTFSPTNAQIIVLKFHYLLDQLGLEQHHFDSLLLHILFSPQKIHPSFKRDDLSEPVISKYIHYLIDYLAVRIKSNKESAYHTPMTRVFALLQQQLRLNQTRIVEFVCSDQSAGERTIKSVLELMKRAHDYQMEHIKDGEQNRAFMFVLNRMVQLLHAGEIKAEREGYVVVFLSAFHYPSVEKFFVSQIEVKAPIYLKYERYFLKYILANWRSLALPVLEVAVRSSDSIKIIFILMQRLSPQDQKCISLALINLQAGPDTLRDLIRINYLLVELHSDCPPEYSAYLQRLIDVALTTTNQLDVHEEVLYLIGTVIKRDMPLAVSLKRSMRATMNTLGNKYCTFAISKLKSPEAQETAMRYFNIVRNFIILAEDFTFIDQFFVTLKDKDLSEARQDILNDYLEDCARTCFLLEGRQPIEWAQMLLNYYWDEELDKDEWNNFRLLIVERLLKKAMPHMKLEQIQELFHRNITNLEAVLKKPLANDSIKSLLLDFQVRKATLLIVELFYGNLPRRQKKEGGLKTQGEIHKIFIKYCTQIAKKNLDETYRRLIKQHDNKEGIKSKAMKVYLEYNCYAYNCLIILFLSTQSNKQHFKSFIFENNKQALWSNLVDVDQIDFHFEILTDFKVMKPYNPLRNKVKEVKERIEKKYFQSSLYVVEEQNIPMGEMPKIQEENEDEEQREPAPINTANNIGLQNIIEEDNINKHICMVNLLRVVDFMHTNFPEPNPGWMRQIDNYLSEPSCSLAERIFLIKLILNRPGIFDKADIWAKHLLTYLSAKTNGGKFIHYFYRDTLKLFIKFLPQLKEVRPDTEQINAVIMKLVRALPYESIDVYTDNIDMLQELIRLPGVYVDKSVINRMLKSDEKDEKKNEWRMCAIIVLKLCISYRVPILTVEQYPHLKDKPARFQYYQVHIKQEIKYVFAMADQSNKKYRIAATGFLGEYLAYIFKSRLSEAEKKQHITNVSRFLVSLVERQSNRNTKEKFSLALENVAMRFPEILAEEKVFACFEDGLVHYNGTEREQLLISFKQYCSNLTTYVDNSKISNFFMTLRINCEKLMADTIDVHYALLELLHICADSRLLRSKDIIFTYYLITDKLTDLSQKNEKLAIKYYETLIKLKHYIIDPEAARFDFAGKFLEMIEEKLIGGLNNKFTAATTLIFSELQKEVNANNESESIFKYISIFKKIYKKNHEELWLVNVVPLLLTICKGSSDYNRFFSQTKLQDKVFAYDWDFRNFKMNDASLPYTPFTIYADKKRDNSTQRSMLGGPSDAANLKGMIRQTQNQYMSQQEQIFTILGTHSQQQSASSQSQLPSQEIQMGSQVQDQKFSTINDLFRNKRRRNEVMQDFKYTNINKTSPAVRYIDNKIRFSKKVKDEDQDVDRVRFRKVDPKQKVKKGALMRAYKVGELPDIGISLQNIVEPLIFLTSRDYELSSELFLQIVSKITSLSDSNCKAINQSLCELLNKSEKCDFNFVSTLQKSLIKICQKHHTFMNISLKQIALKSNTLNYSILFTQENIIQGLIKMLSQEGSKDSIEQSRKERKYEIYQQWYDLTDYYQLLNEHDLIEAVIIRISDGQQRKKMIKALKEKREGDLNQARKHIEDIMNGGIDNRLRSFFQREKIDCSVLLSEWDELATEISTKKMRGQQSGQELKMFTISLSNLESDKRSDFLQQINWQDEKYQYQMGILNVMKPGGMDGARFHALNSRILFRKQWHRISSFAFNSKHDLLQDLQKNFELTEFLELFKKHEVRENECKQLFQKWSSRKPDQIFDDNTTWIQILSSRVMFGKMLAQKWLLPVELMARSNTEWLVQMVNGMLCKGVLGYAQNVIRRALQQHKLSREFNWQFYEAISKLKLLQIIKKGSLKIEQYSIVPKLIQREMDQYNNQSQLAKLRLTMIKNEYLQGYIDVSLGKRKEMDLFQFVAKITQIFKNYEEINKAVDINVDIEDNLKRDVHFRFAIFLENLLSIVKGKFQIKEVKDSVEKKGITIKLIATRFIQQLVYTIKLLNLSKSSALNYQEGQQLFSMILKLIKIVQAEHKEIGKHFEDAITDKQIPKWIFIYFIPQIIKNINNYDISIYFKELFEYLLASHPEALVYPFNCTYSRKSDCNTELTKKLHTELHTKMIRYFEFINNLFLLQHPQLRLKDIFTKYLMHGESQNAFLELQEFVDHNPYIGKYNIRFYENWKKRLDSMFEMKRKGQFKELETFIKTEIQKLDPSKCINNKYFTKVSDGSTWFQEYNSNDWMRIQVPGTSYTQFQEPQTWNKIYIESFDYNLLTLTSIRRPKRITLLGSNEKVYMLLIKGGEDVRLDQRVEQLFELVNRIMHHHPDTNKRQLEISRFEVVPMKSMFGVFEWVDKSKTLRNFLETELKEIKGNPDLNFSSENEAFKEFVAYLRKICPGVDDKYAWHKALMNRPQDEIVRNFNKCELKMPYGLLRFALEKLAKNYDSFLHIKNKFISNYAATCLITYIFGIGDRHLENFLIQTSTGNLVMIDFGYSFSASIELPIPEMIPFRLTKVFKDLAAPIGIDGSFKKSMITCFESLYKKIQLIVDYCDVFVDDPLMEWVWVSRKQLGQGNKEPIYVSSGQSFSVTQEAPERKLFSNKIKIVENKLRGYNPRLILEQLLNDSRHKQAVYIESLKKAVWGKAQFKTDILSGEDLISELLSLSTDKNIIGRSYIGLNLFV